jgi:hypothetical protein
MLLLALIALAQLAVLVMILAVVAGSGSNQQEAQSATRDIRRLEQQTIEALIASANQAWSNGSASGSSRNP